MTFLTSFSSSAASKPIYYPFASTTYDEYVSYIAILKVESLGEMHYIAISHGSTCFVCSLVECVCACK